MTLLIIFTLMALTPFLLICFGVQDFDLYSFKCDLYGWNVYIFQGDGWSLVSFGRELDKPYFHLGNVDLIG